MAFLSGSQVNPALGRTDFTPFLQGSVQGSQMAAQGAAAIGQGIAGLGAGIAQGIDRFKQNKEQEKKMAGVIKVAEKMSAGFEPILEKVDPRIGKTLQELRTTISDPNLSTKERAAAASTFMEQAPNLLNAGLKFFDMQGQQAQQAQELAAKQAQMQAKLAEEQRKKTVELAANSLALGKPVPMPLSNELYNEAVIQAAKLQKDTQRTVRQDVNGTPTQVTYGLGGQIGSSKIQQPPQNMSPEDAAKVERAKVEAGEYAKLGTGFISALSTAKGDAQKQLDLANAVSSAIQSGKVRTGFLAKMTGPLKTAAESVFGSDFGAAEQIIATKGISGLGLGQVRELFRGLGAMSNADRERGEATVVQITDPAQSIKYFAETAKINAERLAEDGKLANKLQRENVPANEIRLRIEELRATRPLISEIAYEKVMGKPKDAPKASVAEDILKKYGIK